MVCVLTKMLPNKLFTGVRRQLWAQDLPTQPTLLPSRGFITTNGITSAVSAIFFATHIFVSEDFQTNGSWWCRPNWSDSRSEVSHDGSWSHLRLWFGQLTSLIARSSTHCILNSMLVWVNVGVSRARGSSPTLSPVHLCGVSLNNLRL